MQRVRATRKLGQSMVITPPGDHGSAIVTMGPGRWEMSLQAPLDWAIMRGELVDLVQAAKKVIHD